MPTPTQRIPSALAERGFLTHDAVRVLLGGVAKSTLFRWEERGLFPQRIHLTPQRPVWRRADVDGYLADPAGWVERNRRRRRRQQERDEQ